MLKCDKLFTYVAISLIISIAIITSCTPNYNHESVPHWAERSSYIPNKNINLIDFVSIVDPGKNINRKLLNQIDPFQKYFSKDDFIQFSEDRYWPEFLKSYDLYIDYRLLNSFALVFTPRYSKEILLYIIQDSLIENIRISNLFSIYDQPYYFLDQRYFVFPLDTGIFDLYGFHNDTLVFKSIYSPNKTEIYENRKNGIHFLLDSLKP